MLVSHRTDCHFAFWFIFHSAEVFPSVSNESVKRRSPYSRRNDEKSTSVFRTIRMKIDVKGSSYDSPFLWHAIERRYAAGVNDRRTAASSYSLLGEETY